MKTIHEEAPEVRQFPGKGKYISFIFYLDAPVVSQLLFLLEENVRGHNIPCKTFHYSEKVNSNFIVFP